MTDPIASCLAAAETDSAADEEEPHPCGRRAGRLRSTRCAGGVSGAICPERSRNSSTRCARRGGRSGIRERVEAYVARCRALVERAEATLDALRDQGVGELRCRSITGLVAHARRQIDQVERRLLRGETIPHEEKVFSIFEGHTRWVSKGKGGHAGRTRGSCRRYRGSVSIHPSPQGSSFSGRGEKSAGLGCRIGVRVPIRGTWFW